MTDTLIVKVQSNLAETRMNPPQTVTKIFVAHGVSRHDLDRGRSHVNFWVRSQDGGSTLYQAFMKSADPQISTEHRIMADAVWIETMNGARIESLYGQVTPAEVEDEFPREAA